MVGGGAGRGRAGGAGCARGAAGYRAVRGGLAAVGPGSAAVALALVAATTVCSAQRWRLVARGVWRRRDAARGHGGVLPVPVPQLRAARWRAGRRPPRADAPGRPLGGVGAGPGAGRGVALALLVVLVAWPAASAPSTTVLAALAVAGIVGGRRSRRRLGQPRGARARGRAARPGALGAGGDRPRSWSSSSRRARSASTPPTTTLVPIALVVLVAAAVPLNVAGWGPREGAAAWAFAAAGLGAAAGASVAVAYGVLALLATLPGRRPARRTPPGPAARAAARRSQVVALRG